MKDNLFDKLKGPFIGLIFFLLLLVLAEGVGFILLKAPDRIERIRSILVQDASLFWRQKSTLDVFFEGAKVTTNQLGLRNKEINRKDKNRLRIVCLGASPTFGWGVKQEKIYSKQLETLFNDQLKERSIEVINAGQIGYSSYQGLKFFKSNILPMKPDVITVSYVINDVDKYRFYRNHGLGDKDLSDKNSVVVGIENFLEQSSFFKVYKDFIVRSQTLSKQYFGQRGQNEFAVSRRVSSEEYRENLKQIIHLARENNIKVVLLKMPVNLPNAHVVSKTLVDQSESMILKASELAQNKQYKEAIGQLNLAVGANSRSAKAHFYLGQYYQRLGDKDKAKEHFDQTVLLELYECDDLAKQYNAIMEDVAKAENIMMVDIVKAFKQYSHNNKDQYLFLDPNHDTIHPNELGHSIIAASIYKLFMKHQSLWVTG